MKAVLVRRITRGTAMVLLGGCSSMAMAQSTQYNPPQPRSVIDENGVNLADGSVNVSDYQLSIGQGQSSLSTQRIWRKGLARGQRGDGWVLSDLGAITASGSTYSVVIGNEAHSFAFANGVFSAQQGDGAQLVYDGSRYYIFTDADGTQVTFDKNPVADSASYYYANAIAVMTAVAGAGGDTTTYTYGRSSYPYTMSNSFGDTTITIYVVRPLSKITNTGLQIKYTYRSNNPSQTDDWYSLASATALNNTSGYCDVNADSCSVAGVATVTYARQVDSNGLPTFTVTDPLGRNSVYGYDSLGRLGFLQPPLSKVQTYGYDGNGRINLISNALASSTYTWTIAGNTVTASIADALNHSRQVVVDASKGTIQSQTDAVGRTSSFGYDPTTGQLTSVTSPSGATTSYQRDSRGNVTLRTVTPAGGGTPMTSSATFPTCNGTNFRICNQPDTATDANGNVTNYSYDAAHGGVTSVKLPAPTSGAVRPETRYSYTQQRASYIQSSGGGVTQAPTTVWRLTGTSSCLTSASCAGQAQEAKSTIAYANNNLFVSSVTKGSGDGNASRTATTTLGYDVVGNTVYADGPISGSGDTVTMVYDAARQLVETVDGTNGSTDPRAVRYGRNNDGQVTSVIAGTQSGSANLAGTGFNPLQTVSTGYDIYGRKTSEVLSMSNGTNYQVQQWAYDAANRVTCQVQRMNALNTTTDACSLTTGGSYGPDRVTKFDYYNDDQVWKVKSAQGVAGLAQDTQTFAYFGNNVAGAGKVSSVTDARGYATSYTYDGFDRPLNTNYPDSTSEALYYGTGASERLYVARFTPRDNRTIFYYYDNLGRLTNMTRPSPADGQAQDSAKIYSYDNMGHVIQTSTGGITLNATWDALGRQTGEQHGQTGLGDISYEYDLADRRTKMTWWDGNYVGYEYRSNGDLYKVNENGAQSGSGVLAIYGYDGLGRRQSLTRGNNTTTSWGYGGTPWLTSLAHTMSGTSANLTRTFTYDAAGAIRTASGNNGAYDFNNYAAVNRTYNADNVNRYTSATGSSFSYDGRGNLTSTTTPQGSMNYGYTSDNMLKSAGGATFDYDGYDRLYRLNQSGTILRYAGDQLVAEENASGTILKRYVPVGTDEPLIWYEGSGLTDRRWFYQDERGSVIATADASGNNLAKLAYDEYGIPATSNGAVRFQYTGQLYLSELGGYHYKARAYVPTLGRFLQTDPIGYADGMNMYAYVGNNPVNFTDPSGLLRTVCSRQDNSYDETGGTRVVASRQICSVVDDTPSGLLGRGDSLGLVAGGRGRPASPPTSPAQPQNNPCSQMGTAMSPRQYANLGRQASLGNSSSSNSAGNSSNLLPLGRLASNLFNFRRNGPLDAEAHGSTKAYGNYTFGVYARAAGFSLKETLDGADLFGRLFSSYDFNTNPADSYATHIPKVNADAIRAGYADGANASSCGRQ